MIFVSVGTQLPFDRLLAGIDAWAQQTKEQVIAQCGKTSYAALAIEMRPFVSTAEYDELFEQADIVVSHAGMGAILGSIYASKPIVIMPRQSSLGEHRNDHQEDTARRFASISGVFVVRDTPSLHQVLNDLRNSRPGIAASRPKSEVYESPLGKSLREWLDLDGSQKAAASAMTARRANVNSD